MEDVFENLRCEGKAKRASTMTMTATSMRNTMSTALGMEMSTRCTLCRWVLGGPLMDTLLDWVVDRQPLLTFTTK